MTHVILAHEGKYWFLVYDQSFAGPYMMVKDTTRYNSKDDALRIVEKYGHRLLEPSGKFSIKNLQKILRCLQTKLKDLTRI